MKNDRRMLACVIYMILGVALVVLGILEILDSFWSGMGGALIAVGAVRTIGILRYRKDEAYRERMEVEMGDERNHFIVEHSVDADVFFCNLDIDIGKRSMVGF